MKRESIKLSEERRAALESAAASVGAVNERGTEAGKPSWRALVYAIADGRVSVRKASKSRRGRSQNE